MKIYKLHEMYKHRICDIVGFELGGFITGSYDLFGKTIQLKRRIFEYKVLCTCGVIIDVETLFSSGGWLWSDIELVHKYRHVMGIING